jgi:hypothetical protein
MGPARKSKLKLGIAGWAACASAFFPFTAFPAHAREAESDVAAPVPCAMIAEVDGQVDVLDASRTHLLDSSKKASIPCGSWISVGKGSVQLKHRDGFRVHAGAGTFVQLPEPNVDGHFSGDQAILFRGQVFAQAGGGSQQLRVLTANSRARVQRGSAIVIYSQDDEETQLIALDHGSSLENRFQTSRKVDAQAGEATSLNFKQLRVVPSTPRAVALAALRPKFDDLRVPERDRQMALRTARSRQDRIFATELVKEEKKDQGEHTARVPASEHDPGQEVRARLEAAKKQIHFPPPAQNYSSRPSDEQVKRIRKNWVGRLVAGESGADNIVSPHAGGSRHSTQESRQAGVEGNAFIKRKARSLTAEDEEKLRLIEELSRIREE